MPSTFSLIPTGPIGTEVLRDAITRYVGAVLDGHGHRYAAVTGILRRDCPRYGGPETIADDADDVARAIGAIERLDRSHLLIQAEVRPASFRIDPADHDKFLAVEAFNLEP